MFAVPTTRYRQGLSAAVLVAAIFLAALTIKYGQEVAGVRILSSAMPLLFLLFLIRVSCPITLPRPVLYLVAAECLALPAISIISKRAISFYELYLPWTVISAVIFVVFFRRFISIDLRKVGPLYAKSLILVCFLSFAFTSQTTWFGAYSIASLSDFSTYFALQLSLAMPFTLFKGRCPVIALFLVTLWFLFSRLSFVLAVAVLFIQRVRIADLRSLTLSIAAATGVTASVLLLAQTSLGTNSPINWPTLPAPWWVQERRH